MLAANPDGSSPPGFFSFRYRLGNSKNQSSQFQLVMAVKLSGADPDSLEIDLNRNKAGRLSLLKITNADTACAPKSGAACARKKGVGG